MKTKLLKGIILSLLFFYSCGEEPSATKTEEVTQLLTGSGSSPKSWKMQSVKVDGTDMSSLFTGMTIAFTDGGFTVTNGGPVWPSSDTWVFTNDTATTIRRGDGVDVTVAVTETSLTLTLTWSKETFGPGRINSVSGQHIFTFS